MEKLKTKNKKALVTNQAQHHNPLLQTPIPTPQTQPSCSGFNSKLALYLFIINLNDDVAFKMLKIIFYYYFISHVNI